MKKKTPQKQQTAQRIPRRYKEDIARLTARYGDLHNVAGEEIVSSLKEFGHICERDQVKISAYLGLINYLKKEFSLRLTLFSRKTRI